ncbi:PEPxxWA-CTERM sorting domain-containing protein [Sandaracinobacteroides hominis]|uniref:PEPxxWA-CTERM sorting domain-containing protein n=1 Tax=Sandaracinobacteroides hominis TaxID=2780086 RepID=UPI001F392F3C|nr:PEPxxWA-CTERM sorting domain-containing protein [Sandaracinobacteroides hominis]
MKAKFLLAAAAVLAAHSADAASYVYVGSWAVDDGPHWGVVPAAYTGQEAAALLFGGSASDYAISTLGSAVGDIDFLSWVSTWGGACANNVFPCGTKVAQGSVISTGGLYASVGDQSAYVKDWAVGAEYANYAFRVSDMGGVPEAATWAMMIAGFGMVGFAMRRRATAALA